MVQAFSLMRFRFVPFRGRCPRLLWLAPSGRKKEPPAPAHPGLRFRRALGFGNVAIDFVVGVEAVFDDAADEVVFGDGDDGEEDGRDFDFAPTGRAIVAVGNAHGTEQNEIPSG